MAAERFTNAPFPSAYRAEATLSPQGETLSEQIPTPDELKARVESHFVGVDLSKSGKYRQGDLDVLVETIRKSGESGDYLAMIKAYASREGSRVATYIGSPNRDSQFDYWALNKGERVEFSHISTFPNSVFSN